MKAFADKGIISTWAVPDRVQFVDTIEKTSVGKQDKKLLRGKYKLISLCNLILYFKSKGDYPMGIATQKPAPPGQAANTQLDFYLLDELLTDEEREVRDRVREFCAREITPIINPYWERGEFPFELIPKLAELNLAGGPIKGYGCPGLSSLAFGLLAAELSAADGSISTFFGVTSGLAMGAIYTCGSEEQRQKWLPPMARLEKIGAFALTEPWIGSDAAHILTRASRVGDNYVLNGAKRWIGNASFADVTVVWAVEEETGQVSGFLVEKDTPRLRGDSHTGQDRQARSAQRRHKAHELRGSSREPSAKC